MASPKNRVSKRRKRERVASLEKPIVAQVGTCPSCGAAVLRVVQATGLGHSKTDLHYRAKRAGFHSLKRVQKGEYEKMY